MEFSHKKKTLLHENLQHVKEVVHKYSERIEKCYIKRQWSQLHAQVDPKKCMKKIEGHNIYGEILAFKATSFQHEDQVPHMLKQNTSFTFPLLTA